MTEKNPNNTAYFSFPNLIAGLLLLMMLPKLAISDLVDESLSRLPASGVPGTGYSVVTGDIDGNGTIDAVVARQAGLKLFINDGVGSFQSTPEGALPSAIATKAFLSVGLVDVDGDFDLDIVAANGGGANVLLINNGNGQFQDESSLRLPFSKAVSVSVVYEDIDSDGDKDLIFANRNSSNQLLLNNGSGVFSDVTESQLGLTSDESNGLLMFDANGDKTKDLLVINDKTIRLLLNNGLGTFVDNSVSHLPAIQFGGISAQVIDVENDGDPDLVFAAAANGAKLLINDGTGHFSDETTTLLPPNNDFVIKVAVDDVDFDGLPDVFLANAGEDRLLLNEGNGHFANSNLLPTVDFRSFGVGLFDIEDDFDSDALLTASIGNERLLVNNIGAPRIRMQVSPDYIEVGDNVTITVEVFDEDGISSDSLIVSAPDGSSQNLTLNSGSALFVPTQEGEHVATYSATDSQGNNSSRQSRFTVFAADTQAPSVSIIISKPDPLLLGQQVGLQVSATDDRKVADLSLNVNGQNLSLDINGQAVYVTNSVGVHDVVATAHDAAGNEGVASDQFVVDVDAQFPVVNLTVTPDPVDVAQTVSFQADATDNVSIASSSLLLTGPGISTPLSIALDANGAGQYVPYQPGTYTATFQASDPSGNSSQTSLNFEVVGIADAEPPVVDIQIVPSSVAIGNSVTLQVTASDNVAVAEKRLEINGTPVDLDTNDSAVYTPPVIGTYSAVAYAVDFNANEGSITKTFKAVDPASDNTAPVVQISSPVEDQEVSGLLEIVGTATDDTFVSYQLSYAPVGTNNFTPFVTGNSEVIDGVLGTFDTSMLENGFYVIQLSAEDVNGLSSYTSVVISVAGDLKLGQFAVSFQDKKLNVGLFPITVTRNYDSRKRTESGDFGFGWNVSLTDAKLSQNRIIGFSWQVQSQGGFITQYALVPTRPHTVSIKFGENKELKFTAKPVPELQPFGYQYIDGFNFEPIGDAKGSLVPIGPTPFIVQSGTVYDFDFNVYNPTGYVYTSEDGYIYRFQGGGSTINFNLTSVTDPNGATVFITPNGFERSDGLGVAFLRDSSGRITRITDPEGNETNYEYDAVGNLMAVVDPEFNRTELVYDSNHYLTEIKDPLGRPVQKQEYDADGRLIALTDATGKRIEMEYDLSAQTQIVRDRRGNPVIYEYDQRGNVTKQTEFPTVNGIVQAVETLRTYDADSQMLSETLPNGMVTTFSYSTAGYLLSRVIDSGGLQLTESFTYDSAGRALTNTDPRNNTVTNVYDSKGRVLTKTGRNGEVTTFEYDQKGNKSKQIDPTGDYTLYEYDSLGNKVAEERFDANNNSRQRKEFSYDNNGNVLSQSVIVSKNGIPTALTTFFEYNRNGQLTSKTDALGNTEFFEYDSVGNKSAEIDKEGHKTNFFYDSRGNLIKKVYADNTFEEYAYDDNGNRIAITNRNGHQTSYEYDALNRVTKTVFADTNSRTTLYDVVGNVIAEIDELGQRTDHEYDMVGRRVKTIQPLVFDGVQGIDLRPETQYTYDENGNKKELVDANGNKTVYEYDNSDRLILTRYADNNTELLEYDSLGRVTKKTDPTGLSTLNEYDGLGRLTKVILPDPDGSGTKPETTYQYDEMGNMLAQIDANGHTTTFVYDDAGNKLSRQLPGGQTESFNYDKNGRVVAHVDFNGNSTHYSYNEVGRLVSKIYEDGSEIQITYSGEGQRLSVTAPEGITSYAYDARNRLTLLTPPSGRAIQYEYDSAGKQTAVIATGSSTHYSYDALGRLQDTVDAGGNTSTNTYDAVGNLVVVDYPNGSQAFYSYNNRNQLLSVANKRADSSVISSYLYSLNANGLRTKVEEVDGSVVDYGYDNNYRLISEVRTGTNPYNHSYQYDLVGNRTESVRDGVTESYSYDANDRLISSGSTTYGYDDNGNRVEKNDSGITTYEYDYENRLAKTIAPNGETTLYTYDVDGNRVGKMDGTGTTEYVLDLHSNTGNVQVMEERNGSGALMVSYTYGHNLMFQNRAGTRSFYHYDGQGSTRELTDLDELVTDSYLYDAYGRSLAVTGSTENAYRFVGEQFDPNVGLYYLRARYYDQNIGRFITTDPNQGDPQSPTSLHRYLYANNNPVNFTDPTGRFSLISISISISISTNIRSVYTQNLVKFFVRALKIAYCTLEPAYRLQDLGLLMVARNVPGGYLVFQQAREMIARGYQAIGNEIISTYKNIANDLISVEVEVGGLLGDLYNAYQNGEIPVPVPEEVAQLLEFKEQLEGWFEQMAETLENIDTLINGNNCQRFTLLADKADDIAGLIPDF